MRLMKSTSLILSLSLILVLPGAAVAETPRAAKPEDVGISSQRLQRIQDLMQRNIDVGNFSGAVTLLRAAAKLLILTPKG